MKSNIIDYYSCANVIDFIVKYENVIVKSKGIYVPFLFSEYAVGVPHWISAPIWLAGTSRSTISIHSEEASSTVECISMPDCAYSDPSYLQMLITF